MPYTSSYGSGLRGGLTPWVLRLLVLISGIFVGTIFVNLFGLDVTGWLALSPTRVLYQPWTVVTYAFTHGLNVFGWLFNSLMLFFFGPRLEERWGGRGFLLFWLTGTLGAAAGALAMTAMGIPMPLIGATLVVDCLLMAWALFWPTEEILLFGIIPLQIRWLFVGVLAVSLLQNASKGMQGFLYLVPMAASLAAAWGLLHSPWAPRGWGDVPKKRQPARKTQRAVVPWTSRKQEAPAQTAAPRPAAAAGARRTARAEKDLLDDVDRILDKISAQGLSSLTEDERKRLDEVSRRYRTN